MGYYVQTYLTDAEEIEKIYSSKDINLFETLSAYLATNFKNLDDYFADNSAQPPFAKNVLLDIVYGTVRFPKAAFMYGYVYEMLCKYYGEHVFPPYDEYSTNYYQTISKRPQAFIPIPLTGDFPEIYSIRRADLEKEKERFLQLTEREGMPAEYIREEKEAFEFIFEKAVNEQKDLVFFLY